MAVQTIQSRFLLLAVWLFALSACVVGAVSGQPGPDDVVSVDLEANRGEDCYYGKGTRTDCKDCSKKKSTRACYQCCNDNCQSNGATQCQNLCDESYSLGFDRLASDNELANHYVAMTSGRVDAGFSFTYTEVRVLEYISAASTSEAVRRFALAVLTDAWALGLYDDDGDAVFVESFEAALVGDDIGVRRSALRLLRDNPVPVDVDHVVPHLIKIAQAGVEFENRVASTYPDYTRDEVDSYGAKHRQAATDAVILLMSR